MGGGSKKQTVGYKYYLGEHLVFCHGPVDSFKRLTFDGTRIAWEGFQNSEDTIAVYAPSLFGGEDIGREGGVLGAVDFCPGEPTQLQNDYLQARLGTDIPAFRGVTALVFRQMYLGTSAYLKKVSARFTRIRKSTEGVEQWYVEKAAIGTIADKPLALYFAIDLSGSMDDITSNGLSRLANMKTALKAVMDFIDEKAVSDPNAKSIDIMIVGFGTQPSSRTSIQRLDVDSSDIADLKSWINSRSTIYWTYFPAGVMDAPQFFNVDANPLALKKLFFITDGEPSTSDSSQTPTQIAAQASSIIFGFDIFAGFTIPGLEAYAINIDLSDTTYTAYLDNTPGDGIPVVAGGDPTALVEAIAAAFTGQEDMNPAHIIRECLTDNLWGMGYNAADIDDDSFTDAADKLHAEGMGISILWDRQMAIEDFIKEIVKHVDASLYVDRGTGKFVLKLIRGDYDIETIPLLDESNIDKVESFQRQSFGELTNSVTVNYWNSTTGQTASLTIEDPALILMQGAVINTTLQYPGFTNASLASRAGSRDLRTLSNPLASCSITANSVAEGFNIGSVFRWSWAEYGIVNMPMRVIGIAFGDGVSNKVKMQVSQDVFVLPETGIVKPPDISWEDPNEPPSPVQKRVVEEMTYYEMVQQFGQTNTDAKLASGPDTGRLAMSGVRPVASAINASLRVDAGAGYEDAGILDFSPAAQLDADVDREETSWTMKNWEDQDVITVETYATIGQEKVYIESMVGDVLTVKRGVLDTIPVEHNENDWLVFDDVFAISDGTDYVASDNVNVKMLTVTGEGVLSEQFAAIDNVDFNSRAIRPYPPADWKINGLRWPTDLEEVLTNTWVTRNRILQTASELVGYYDAAVTEEAGVTYTMRLYDSLMTFLYEETGITTSPHSFEPPEEDGTYTLEFIAVRDGYEQYFSLTNTFDFVFPFPDDVLASSILTKLRHYYSMSETSGTLLRDQHNGAHMTLVNTGNINYNGTTVKTGGAYGAMRFTSTGAAQINGTPYWQWKQFDFAMFGWTRFTNTTETTQRAFNCNAASSDSSAAVNIVNRVTIGSTTGSNSGQPEFFWEHNTGVNDSVPFNGSTPVTTSNTCHAFNRNDTLKSVAYFLNAALNDSQTYTVSPTGGNSSSNKFTIGNTPDLDMPLRGYVQDLMFLNSPLTSNEIVYLYNGGAGKTYQSILTDAVNAMAGKWSPAQLTKMALWFISDDPDNTIASGKITAMNNRVGLGAGLIVSGTGAKHGTSTLNSRSVITADATDIGRFRFDMTTLEIVNGNGIAAALVFKKRTSAGAAAKKVLLSVQQSTATLRFDVSSDTVAANDIGIGSRRTNGGTYVSTSDGVNHGTNWVIAIAQADFVAGNHVIWTDGVQRVSTNNATTGALTATASGTGVEIGGYSGNTNTHSDYELAEVVLLVGVLTSTEREKMEGYLAHKWGLTGNLDVAHPYKSTFPTI